METLKLRGRPDRYNGGTMRRYHFTNGTILVVNSAPLKRAVVIPSCAPCGVSVEVPRAEAVKALRAGRMNAKAQ